jgi:hypothetical protein
MHHERHSLSTFRSRALSCALAGAIGLLSLIAARALAEGPTRADYIAQADPICRTAFKEKLPQPKDRHDVKGYGRLFSTMGHRIEAMTDRLDRVPKPVADEFGLGNWLKSLHSWAGASSSAGSALRHRNIRGYKAALRKLNRAQKIRLNASATFGFQVCR